jgi:hypothetical protein
MVKRQIYSLANIYDRVPCTSHLKVMIDPSYFLSGLTRGDISLRVDHFKG